MNLVICGDPKTVEIPRANARYTAVLLNDCIYVIICSESEKLPGQPLVSSEEVWMLMVVGHSDFLVGSLSTRL